MLLEFLTEYGMFFAKVATFVIAAFLIIGAIASASHRQAHEKGGVLHVKKLNEKYEGMEHAIRTSVMDEASLKVHEKLKRAEAKDKARQEKKLAKSKAKKAGHATGVGSEIVREVSNNVESNLESNVENNAGHTPQAKSNAAEGEKTVYVIDFDGDMKASAVEHLREEITAVLTMATPGDEVVIKLESPGGMVHAYGLAASQLARFKQAGVPLTVCVDKVAASGGYMMACIADKLLAAPFAVIGSIGVVASIPNFNRVLKKHDVDYELLTAGEYKRTLTMLGENTEEGRKKFVTDLEDTHSLFKDFVTDFRPQLDIAEVATGETWYGKKALEKSLIDAISTSDEYLTSLANAGPVYEISYVAKKNWQEKLGMAAQAAVGNSLEKVFSALASSWNTRH